MFKYKSILIFLILIIPAAVFFFFNRTGESVICTKVIRGQILDSVSGNIKILADQNYNLKANLPGTVISVAKLPLQKSITVKTGQPIVHLDISDLNRSLEQAIISKSNFNKTIQAGSINALEFFYILSFYIEVFHVSNLLILDQNLTLDLTFFSTI